MTRQTGILYVVATPIGNLEDLTPRARRVLAEVDTVAAEDTRHSGQLLKHAGISTPLISLHDHNEAERAPKLIARLLTGESIALISDAGTPLISDPGYDLVRAARQAGISVTPVPGACALVAALSVSGLPTDRFVFEGFLPGKQTARRTALQALAGETRTLVFYESVHRLAESLSDMGDIFGAMRQAVIARELTKLHEAVRDGTLAALLEWATSDAHADKGEVVLLIRGISESPEVADSERVLDILLTELPVKQAAALTAKLTGGKRNELYKKALGRSAGR
ncbi:MAG TPA: 16S rRNA (cytidine(1402)-2'-O)-methyltransferase [Gammaproteobacteria bacterium]|nr:16S rRNA (cytidine(1402)-2'-O)-methyltransferase [Gammaproteobacteria bacterium]